MKILCYKLIVFAAFVFGANPIKAQYQSLFGDSTASWNVTTASFWPSPSDTDSLYTVSDTVINSNVYKRIEYRDVNSPFPYPGYTVGFLREDTVQGKAWYFTNQDTTEYLIMDLNLNLGDTFYVGGTWNGWPGYHSVDSIWTNAGKKYLRLNLYINTTGMFGSYTDEKLIFIEGIGTNVGIAYQTNGGDNYPYLLCSSKDGILNYQNSLPVLNGSCNYKVVGIDENRDENQIRLYPNPSSNVLVIDNLPINTTMTLEIRNVTGKLVLNRFLSQPKKTISINIDDLPSGLYLVTIKDHQKVVSSQKWVKQ